MDEIVELLMTENARVSCGRRWLLWGDSQLWEVIEHKDGARRTD